MDFNDIYVQPISAHEHFTRHNISLDVLRLDAMHPIVSGNKYFKLKFYLQEAITSKANGVATFGGAYSNHIVACAFACKEAGIPCTGIIRGEEPAVYNATLMDAKKYGMHLHFVSRQDYRDKESLKKKFNTLYWINEGGYGNAGAEGVKDIFNYIPGFEKYHWIVCAVGTGTTMAGLIKGAAPNQQVLGISVIKNNFSLEAGIRELLPEKNKLQELHVLHDFHFGGYAKYAADLIQFMNETWKKNRLPLDFVYTAKAYYAIHSLIKNKYFSNSEKILFIHSGGLQGNRSLPENTLQF